MKIINLGRWFGGLWASLVLAAPALAAGGWASGSGELYRDARNPWFLKNTGYVSYCVQIDEAVFGLGRSLAEERIEAALRYWLTEIRDASPTPATNDVGTQTFSRMDRCTADTDLTFQLGVLTEEQRQHIGDPTQFAALSLRTDYDSKTLHGRGFVYVAPQSGPLRPRSLGMINTLWAAGESKLLQLTLMHELGHVFGLGHMGSDDQLMGEGYVERILSNTFSGVHLAAPFPHVLALGTYFYSANCLDWFQHDPYRVTNRFFGIEPSWICKKLELTKSGFTVYAKPNPAVLEWTKVGAATFSAVAAELEVRTPFKAYLTAEQQVFPQLLGPAGAQPWQGLNPVIPVETKSGTYNSEDGAIKHLVIAVLDPARPKISGVVANGVIPDLFSPFEVVEPTP